MNIKDFLKKQYIIPILLGLIIILLMNIMILLVLPGRGQRTETSAGSDMQQNITDYAETQIEQDNVPGSLGETTAMEPVEDREDGNAVLEEPDNWIQGNGTVATDKKNNIVIIDIEDEEDVAYSKDYILNEIFPYFESNNHEAIWDLVHLKRYIKLSSELKGTNKFYYKGNVNKKGEPDGKGLAIYEDNSYYYGDWSNGVRSGGGRWFRFYINEKSKRSANGAYTSHSYAGEWVDDLPNGLGAEHFDVDISQIDGSKRIIQNVVGNFTDGLYDGEMVANTVSRDGNIEEWDGVTTKGVFTLWRDMSAIGECSVWRNNEDHNLCLDIDKSENKNQGIKELMKLNTK